MSEFAKEVLPVNLVDEMRSSYLDYAMSVIVGRALPDARDGLKPVHRRVLFSMHKQGNAWNKKYVKSATIVGDVMGKYHPHGDIAIYDTLVRMAQPFSLRYPLVDGQGNFGSMDGDPPAAYRYTEARMAKIAHSLLTDIEKETVDFAPNYDGSQQEPVVLPARLPHLLVNGSSGIAVGMATNVPPHHLGETLDACLYLLDHPAADTAALMRYIPGPDFPPARSSTARAASARPTKPVVDAFTSAPKPTSRLTTTAANRLSSWTNCPTRSTRPTCWAKSPNSSKKRKSTASLRYATNQTKTASAW